MAGDAARIRALIQDWAEAVHAGDLGAVVADHGDEIVMFDVPPPERGVRGIDAYQATWPPFFEWQRSGASFEIEELEVIAGDDIIRLGAAPLRHAGGARARSRESASLDDRPTQGSRPLGRHARAPLVPTQGLTRDCPGGTAIRRSGTHRAR